MRERIPRARRRVEQSCRRTSRRFFLLSRKGHREYASAPSSWFTFSSLVHLLLLRGTCRSQVYERAGYRHCLLAAQLSVAVWSLPGSRRFVIALGRFLIGIGHVRVIIHSYLTVIRVTEYIASYHSTQSMIHRLSRLLAITADIFRVYLKTEILVDSAL